MIYKIGVVVSILVILGVIIKLTNMGRHHSYRK